MYKIFYKINLKLKIKFITQPLYLFKISLMSRKQGKGPKNFNAKQYEKPGLT